MENPSFDPATLKKYIIHEDAMIVALNKPEGLLTIPDGYKKDLPNLRDLLQTIYGSIWVVHRLDKLTSGVIIFAKNRSVHKELNLQFQKRKIIKKYIALIHGFPFWEEKLIDLPIRMNGDRQHRTVVDLLNGKQAISKVEVVNKNKIFSVAQIFPNSGYSHQIRCHLAALGHPIIGDNLYCLLKHKDPIYVNPELRLFLHAESITFNLSDKTPLTLCAPIPDIFNSFDPFIINSNDY
ncbi:MAG: RluA family pseudouridine synthase [Pelolinea sp.]|nr:RluA family pseudouridine synthase [Pelolinea sp.]